MTGAATTPGGTPSLGARLRDAVYWALARMGVPFFLVACTITYYGQLHRVPTGDAYGTVYVAVALVQDQTVFLDDFLPYIQARAGDQPYMLKANEDGRIVNGPPLASSLLAVPVIAAFDLFGAEAEDFDSWMEAAMLTASLTAAAAAALLFLLLTRLTSRRRAALITAVYAWGTLAWGINSQALWQHGGAALALIVALIMLVDRRYTLAGVAMLTMVAFRPSTPVIAACLLPLLGLKVGNWLRFAAGAAPVVLGVALYNLLAFGSLAEQGYGGGHVSESTTISDPGGMVEAGVSLLVSPGRGLLLYTPVLLFALAGGVLGMRTPIYRWSLVAVVVYPFAIGNLSQWSGNESFGARKLAETLPLYAVLLVPALDLALRRRRWLWAMAGAIALSVGVQLLGAAMWPPATWFGDHDILSLGAWWHVLDNEIVAMLSEPSLVPRVAAMAGLLLAAVAVGLVADTGWSAWRGSRRRATVTDVPVT